MVNVKNHVEETVNDIWRRYADQDFCQLPPLSVDRVPDHGIIFIGLNPSIDDKERERLLRESDGKMKFYPHHEDVKSLHPYFHKFPEIAEYAGLPWGHIDLLYMREKRQGRIHEIIRSGKNGLWFIIEQLDTTKKVLNDLLSQNKPIIFVVNNSLARDFLGKNRPPNYSDSDGHWMDYRFEWSDDLGTDVLKKNGHRHPFFFTSMLTGQRALDIGSFERLKWHIRYVKEKLH